MINNEPAMRPMFNAMAPGQNRGCGAGGWDEGAAQAYRFVDPTNPDNKPAPGGPRPPTAPFNPLTIPGPTAEGAGFGLSLKYTPPSVFLQGVPEPTAEGAGFGFGLSPIFRASNRTSNYDIESILLEAEATRSRYRMLSIDAMMQL